MLRIICALIFIALLPTTSHAKENILDTMQKLEKSLVHVKTILVRTMKTPKGLKQASYTRQGTGIIIDKNGFIVTNTHIIKNAPRIDITLYDGHVLYAQVLYVNIDHDFSILKVNTSKPLKPVPFADSSHAQIGETIYAIGSSDFNDNSILSGQITSLIQSLSQGTIEFLETNLNLYQGDSGGPIFNAQGKLLGMVMGKNKRKNRSSLCIASDRIREQYLRLPK